MPTYFLIGSGQADPLDYYQDLIQQSDMIVGIDGGTNLLFSLQCKPDWVIGDNDSIHETTLQWLESFQIKPLLYPIEKNQSDFELAAERIIQNYSPGVIYLAAMLGGRIDHEVMNFHIGASLNRAGFTPLFVSEHTWVGYISGGKTFKGTGRAGDTLSIIPFSDFIWITELVGLKYPLMNKKVEKLCTRLLSNVLLSNSFEIASAEGEALLVLHSKHKIRSLLFHQGG